MKHDGFEALERYYQSIALEPVPTARKAAPMEWVAPLLAVAAAATFLMACSRAPFQIPSLSPKAQRELIADFGTLRIEQRQAMLHRSRREL